MISIAIETILGALTGYVTNDVALRQLFRAGGVVEKERASFIDMLVAMLQREILDEETMQELAENEAVVDFFDVLLQRMLHDILPMALQDGGSETAQRYEALLAVLEDRLKEVSWPDVWLETEAIVRTGDDIFADDTTWQALWHLLEQESLSSLGLGKSLAHILHRMRKQPVAHRLDWLAKQEERLQRILGAGAEAFYPILHEDITPRDVAKDAGMLTPGENSVETVVAIVGRALGEDPDFSEVLLEVTRRHLEEIMQLHLPDILALLERMLADHHHELETIAWSAIDEALEEMREPFRTLVRKTARKRLEGDTDWFGQLFAALQEDEMLSRLCGALSRSILLRLENALCQLQEAESPDLAALSRYRALPLGIRESLEARVEERMNQPLLAGVSKVSWNRFVVAQGQRLLVRIIEKDRYWGPLRAYLNKWMHEPFRSWLLTPDRREPAQAKAALWWQKTGRHTVQDLLADQCVPGALWGPFVLQVIQNAAHVPPEDAYQLVLNILGPEEEKNLATWLRGLTFAQLPSFVARLTHERLDALTQTELRQLVLNLLGKEMRPLSYLGAGVGAAAGVATGTGMALSGMAPDPQMGAEAAALFAGRSFFYGAVGYGTNVMAVRGLFRPYKKKFGWQGLLPKNQARFSVKMSEMADTYVLNTTIWDDFARQALERWDGHRGSIADRMSTEEMLALATAKAQGVWPDLPASLLATATVSAVPGLLQQRPIKNQLAFHLSRTTQRLLHEQAQSYPYPRQAMYLMHQFGESLAFAPLARNAVRQTLLAQTKAPVAPWLKSLSDLTDSVTLPEADQLEPIVENLSQLVWEKALPLIRQLRPLLSEKLADEVFARLPFFMQMGFAAMDGERTLDHALEIILDRYAPAYLERHQKDFSCQISAHFTSQWSGKSLTDIGWVWSRQEVDQLRKSVLELAVNRKIDKKLAEGFKRLFFQPGGGLAGVTADALGCMSRHLVVEIVDQPWGEGAQVFYRQLITGLSSHPAEKWHQLFLPLQRQALYKTAGVPVLKHWLSDETSRGLDQAITEILRMDERERMRVLRPFLLEIGDRVYPPVVDHIRAEGRVLVALVDLPEITKKQMDGLDPEELEGLVRQIANPYFRHVERMGWWGAVVAVPASVMVLLFS